MNSKIYDILHRSDSLDKDGSQYELPTKNNEFSVLMVCGHIYIASLTQHCLSQMTTKQKVLKVNSSHYQDNIFNISLCCSGHILHGHLWPPCKEVQVAGHPSPRFSLCCIFTHSYSHLFSFTQLDTMINSSHCIQMQHLLIQPTNYFYYIVACVCSTLSLSLHEPASTHYCFFIVGML